MTGKISEDSAVSTFTGAETVPLVQGGANVRTSMNDVGSFRGSPVTKTADFTVAATENNIISNRAATNTGILPAAASFPGRAITVKTIQAQTVVSASSNVVPLTSATAGTAILSATAGKWAQLVSDGTNWIIMAGN